jgi:DNA-binding NtrC family response regulator
VRVIAATHCDLEQAIRDGRFREDLYYRLNIIRIEVPPLRERRDEILPLARYFITKHSKPTDPPVEINQILTETLMAHSWPGNIRELENVIRTLVVLREPDSVAEELRRAAARRQGPIPRNETPHRPDYRYMAGSERIGPSPALGFPDAFGRAGIGETTSTDGPRCEPSVNTEPATGYQGSSSALGKVDEARRQAELEAILTALNTTLWNRKQAAALLEIEYKALLYKMKKLSIGEKTRAASA